MTETHSAKTGTVGFSFSCRWLKHTQPKTKVPFLSLNFSERKKHY